jgi:hypothetical protein
MSDWARLSNLLSSTGKSACFYTSIGYIPAAAWSIPSSRVRTLTSASFNTFSTSKRENQFMLLHQDWMHTGNNIDEALIPRENINSRIVSNAPHIFYEMSIHTSTSWDWIRTGKAFSQLIVTSLKGGSENSTAENSKRCKESELHCR